MATWRRFAAVLALTLPLTAEVSAQLPPIEQATARQIHEVVRSSASEVTVVNFWATWCIPCREELPAFVRLGKEFDSNSVRVVFVSADFPENVPEARHFLAEHGVTDLSYLRVGDDQKFINFFNEEWSGALPATALYSRGARMVDFWEGKTSYEDLAERVLRILAQERVELPDEEQRP